MNIPNSITSDGKSTYWRAEQVEGKNILKTNWAEATDIQKSIRHGGEDILKIGEEGHTAEHNKWRDWHTVRVSAEGLHTEEKEVGGEDILEGAIRRNGHTEESNRWIRVYRRTRWARNDKSRRLKWRTCTTISEPWKSHSKEKLRLFNSWNTNWRQFFTATTSITCESMLQTRRVILETGVVKLSLSSASSTSSLEPSHSYSFSGWIVILLGLKNCYAKSRALSRAFDERERHIVSRKLFFARIVDRYRINCVNSKATFPTTRNLERSTFARKMSFNPTVEMG